MIERMDLYFKTNRGSFFSLEIAYFDSVLEIKEKVQKYHGIPVSKQTLIFNNNILPDDLSVHYSDILDRSVINLVIASDNDLPPPKLRLRLKMPASKLLAVEVDFNDTIQRLKQRIHELEGTPVCRLAIYANGNELSDQKTMLDCELSEISDVTVVVRPPPPYPGKLGGSVMLRVVVKYGAEKVTVEVNAAENVGEVKKKLQTVNLNLPEEGYFFIYKQSVMDDDRSFRWHHVRQGDTIEIFSGTVSGGS